MGVPPGLQVHFYHFYGYEVYNRTRTHTRTCRARYGYRCKVMATGRERIFMYPMDAPVSHAVFALASSQVTYYVRDVPELRTTMLRG